ncbi:hypothetical protein NM208_g3373 [Fusarium decemcellulare]|uniref:Uncharacterized protein n=1 Tax=Fusarium decemcellulare TaxID=57161 RepID=A0ACC1SPH8_9HYPO|nr:hypothetical protein NM208_g3373 [Fusarium decemcellulare]
MALNNYQSGDAITQALHDIFFEPEQDLALQAIKRHYSLERRVRINGRRLSFDTYQKSILFIRQSSVFFLTSDGDMLDGVPDERRQCGPVTYHTAFMVTEKVSRIGRVESTVSVVTCVWKQDGVFITEITEVCRY